MSDPNISSTFILKKNNTGNEWINPPSTYYWWVCWAKEKPLLRSDNTALMVEDVWYDLLAGTVKVYNGIEFTPAGVIGNSNNGFITENVEFRIVDQNTNPVTQTGILSFYGGDVPTRIYQIEVENGKLNIRKADGEIVMNLDAAGNASFTKNVTVTGDLFADDVGYDEALINILRVEDRIEHNGNATNKITFETDKVTIDASGTSIVLDDAAMADKIVITGQTKFINNIDDVPDIYLQNHIYHSGDNNTRIGFPANDEITLRTNGVDRMHVISNGNIGIGTPTPEVQLDVRGANSEIQVVATSGNPTISLSNAEGPSARREFIATYNTAIAGGGRTELTSIDQGDNFTPISILTSGLRVGTTHASPGASVGLEVASGALIVGQSTTSGVEIRKSGLLTGTQGYLKLGGNETGSLGYRLIGFGYNFSNNNQPAYIGFQEMVSTGQTSGDLVFATRNSTANAAPSERMRIKANGDVIYSSNSASTVEYQTTLAGLDVGVPIVRNIDVGRNHPVYAVTIDSTAYISGVGYWNNSVARGYVFSGTLFGNSVTALSQSGISVDVSFDTNTSLRITFTDTSGVSSPKVGTARIVITTS
jgi:hypothetical protein